MSLWIDLQYLKQISHQLERFKEKKVNKLFNLRCPLCGDSQKKKSKTRGYFYEAPDGGFLLYRCFNCNASLSFSSFLKIFDRNLWDQYRLEKFKNDKQTKIELDKEEIRYVIPDILKNLDTIDDLEAWHPAKKYVIDRGIGEQFWSKIYYVPEFFKWAKNHEPLFKNSIRDHERIIIPWFNLQGKCFAYSARSMHGEDPKYYKIKLDKNDNSFFGMERIRFDRQQYVVEGPLDSLFLPNCIAVGNANIGEYHNPNAIYIPDKDVRNKDILKIVENLIKSNYKVCMMPNIEGKDINEYLESGITQRQLLQMIKENTFQGLKAQLRFTTWRKFVDEPKQYRYSRK